MTLQRSLSEQGYAAEVNVNEMANVVGLFDTHTMFQIEDAETIFSTGKVTVDFLIPPTQPGDTGGKLRDIEVDFAAVIAPGLHLAFQDRRRVTLSGRTIMGESATRDVSVFGPGAYVVLKALAFGSRGENKDAYDLFYVVRNFGSGVEDVAAHLRPLLALSVRPTRVSTWSESCAPRGKRRWTASSS